MMEVVTGGSGSGKSVYAESRICGICGERFPLYYIADMVPYGRETKKKIERHRQQRAGKGFTTLEWYTDLPGKMKEPGSPSFEKAGVLLECISNLTANEMYEPSGAKQNTVQHILKGIRMLKDRSAHLVIVTNDVFRESGTVSQEMIRYKEYLGAVNREMASMADRVTEVVYGVPVILKNKDGDSSLAFRVNDGYEYRRGKQLIFITGGAFQGKREFAECRWPGLSWTDGKECPLDIARMEAVDHFHDFIRRWITDGRPAQELIRKMMGCEELRIVISDEIGCGLVPVDAFEREYREMTGRICTRIARNADEVYRVVCGTGMKIRQRKGENGNAE